MESRIEAGRRFGKLTVIEDSGRRRGECILWRCRCDCGGECLAVRRQLISGAVASCGCAKQKRTVFVGAEDLTDRRFGKLTALRRVENDKNGKPRWMCQCDCGGTKAVAAQDLKNGRTRSCGCERYSTSYNMRDLTGRRFGRLTALYPVRKEDRGTATSACWRCRCDCGREADVYAASLLKGLTRSCGCLNREQQAKMHEHMHYGNDTCVERLIQVQKDYGENKAGFRGLFLTKDGRYRVTITFQKVHYNLGYYRDFDKAAQARLDAEETLHQGYIDAYQAYEDQAEADPAWAEANPFVYRVTRMNGEFQVYTNAMPESEKRSIHYIKLRGIALISG